MAKARFAFQTIAGAGRKPEAACWASFCRTEIDEGAPDRTGRSGGRILGWQGAGCRPLRLGTGGADLGAGFGLGDSTGLRADVSSGGGFLPGPGRSDLTLHLRSTCRAAAAPSEVSVNLRLTFRGRSRWSMVVVRRSRSPSRCRAAVISGGSKAVSGCGGACNVDPTVAALAAATVGAEEVIVTSTIVTGCSTEALPAEPATSSGRLIKPMERQLGWATRAVGASAEGGRSPTVDRVHHLAAKLTLKQRPGAA